MDTLTTVTLADLKDLEFEDLNDQKLWGTISEENKFGERLEKAVKETLYIGDGAFKWSLDPTISQSPIIEFYPGERIEIISSRGRVREIVFKTVYDHDKERYILLEHYGYGYVTYELTKEGKALSDINCIPQTAGLKDIKFGGYDENEEGSRGSFMMAVPTQFFESGKWDERGQSIFDKKVDCFDALDEVWSQWMDALRVGRAKEYIPEGFVPKNPHTGELLTPNYFDHRFISYDSDMGEDSKNKIEIDQPDIPHESYLATYVTALDQCLQGIISPSTLGIDMKKVDNADAQREKEKATLYSRNAIVQALQKILPSVATITIKVHNELNNLTTKDVKATCEFGEYANPSFESQVETVGKGKMQGIMSIEASVEELYGDNKDEEWKKEEILRLKAEQGIEVVDEPSVAGLDGISQAAEPKGSGEVIEKE